MNTENRTIGNSIFYDDNNLEENFTQQVYLQNLKK
jgi:hypothetical protein